jgi:hypothetical protein
VAEYQGLIFFLGTRDLKSVHKFYSGVLNLCLFLDRVHRAVTAAGIQTDGPPRFNADYGVYHFFTKDPDGYTVEVQRFV